MGFEEVNQSPEIVDVLKNFAKCPRGFLLLAGTNGTGKTFAAMKVYESFAKYKLPKYDIDNAWFITQAALNLEFNKYNKKYGYTDPLLENLCKTQLLILDDIGTRTPSEPFMDFLYMVADTRYEKRHQLGTVITTNLKMGAMREKLSDAFVSRVASGKCFRIDGEDRRSNN